MTPPLPPPKLPAAPEPLPPPELLAVSKPPPVYLSLFASAASVLALAYSSSFASAAPGIALALALLPLL